MNTQLRLELADGVGQFGDGVGLFGRREALTLLASEDDVVDLHDLPLQVLDLLLAGHGQRRLVLVPFVGLRPAYDGLPRHAARLGDFCLRAVFVQVHRERPAAHLFGGHFRHCFMICCLQN